MASTVICEGDLAPNASGGLDCSTGWQIVPYVEPTDTTAIYGQLVALNELDPAVISLLVTGSLALFITGYCAGLILKKLRQA